jgi:hypothetical protein
MLLPCTGVLPSGGEGGGPGPTFQFPIGPHPGGIWRRNPGGRDGARGPLSGMPEISLATGSIHSSASLRGQVPYDCMVEGAVPAPSDRTCMFPMPLSAVNPKTGPIGGCPGGGGGGSDVPPSGAGWFGGGGIILPGVSGCCCAKTGCCCGGFPAGGGARGGGGGGSHSGPTGGPRDSAIPHGLIPEEVSSSVIWAQNVVPVLKTEVQRRPSLLSSCTDPNFQ